MCFYARYIYSRLPIIIELNNFDNVYTACFTKNDKLIGHQVCIPNQDGSDFDGKIKPLNTIIVDPWIGKVDFANLLLPEYKISLRNCHYI